MNEEQDAERLARWLEDPSADPPSELDPEVVGAVYTLSPKHRPAPRLSIEEILAGVTEGPFAAPATPPEEKKEGRRDRIRSSSQGSSENKQAAPAPARRAPPSRRWVLPVVGTAMAGMLVLLVVVPGLFLQGSSEKSVDAHTPMPEMAATTPPRPMASAPAEDEPPAYPAPPALLAERAYPASEVPRPATMPAPAPAPAGGPEFANDAGTQGRAAGASPDADQAYLQSGPPAEQEQPPTTNTAAPEPNSASVADNYALDGDRAEQDQDDEAVIAEAVNARRPSSREKKTAETAPSAGAAYAPAPAAAKSAVMEEEEPPIWPQDYRERWYVGDAEVEPTYQAAQALEQTGQWTAAAVAYRSLFASSRSSVAQDAAWRCASAWWKAGQGSTALTTIEEGLRRSSANTPYRARLFALKGDILSAQGKATQAEAAWREARALNASR